MYLRRMIRRRAERRGAASVELAMVAPILILLLFGIVEFGLIFNSLMQLNNVGREGARIASVGARPYEIYVRMLGAAGRLDPQALTAQVEYRTFNGYYWTAWTTVGDDGYNNNAPPGSQIRVRCTYSHKLVLGALFGRFADDTDGNTKLLKSTTVMRRE